MASRTATWALAGVLAAGLGAGAVGVAAANSTPTPKPAASDSAQPAKPKDGKHARHHRPLLRRVAHGQATVRLKGDWHEIALQRGEITKVSATSIGLRSEDGFQATYVLTGDTKVRSRGQQEQVSDLQAGERAMVVAVKDGDRLIARRVSCVREGRPAMPKT